MKICKRCGACIDDYAMTCPNCKSPSNYLIPESSSSRSNQNLGHASHPSRGQGRPSNPSYGQARSSTPSYGQARSSNPSYGQARSSNPSYGQVRSSNPSYGQDRPSNPSYSQDKPSNPSYGQAKSSNPSYGQAKSSNPSYELAKSSNQTINCVVNNKSVEAAPALKLKTDRSLPLYIFLGIITLGIYSIVVMSSISSDINTIASRHDEKKTMHFCLMFFVFSWLTLGIYPLVWYHQLSARIGAELQRRNIPYSFGAGNFWGWYVLGSFLFGIGPIIYCYQLFNSMNMLSVDYNTRG